jgi:hypothetical protein
MQRYPVLPSTVGKRGRSVMPPDGRHVRYRVVDEVRAYQDGEKNKVVLMQLMRLEDRRYEIRVGYYIVGKLPKMRGKWVWGQFAAFIPPGIFKRLVASASKRGWFERAGRTRITAVQDAGSK